MQSVSPYDRWLEGRRTAIVQLLDGVRLGESGLVLDIAAGDAGFSRLVAGETGGRLVASDFSAAECVLAAGGGTPAIHADARRLPFRDGAADLVVAFEVIEHFPAWEVDGFIDELWRVTRPGGSIVLSTPNRYSFQSLRGVARYLRDGTVWNAEDQTHVQVFSLRALRKALEKRFTIDREVGYYLVPEVRGKPSPWTHVVTQRRATRPFCHKLLVRAHRSS